MIRTYLIAAFLFLAGCSVAETQKLPSNAGAIRTNSALFDRDVPSSDEIPPYVPPRGPTYGAAAVVSRKYTQGKIPYGSLQPSPARPAARP
jgi:hypothetical protein